MLVEKLSFRGLGKMTQVVENVSEEEYLTEEVHYLQKLADNTVFLLTFRSRRELSRVQKVIEELLKSDTPPSLKEVGLSFSLLHSTAQPSVFHSVNLPSFSLLFLFYLIAFFPSALLWRIYYR